MKSELAFARSPFSIPQLQNSLITNIDNHSLKNITLPQMDALVEYLDSYKPSLKIDIQNLTSLLTPLIEDQRLPDQRLKLEILTKSQITSGEYAARLLKELLEFSDDYSSPLVETPRSDLSSTYSLVSSGEQAGGSRAQEPSPTIATPPRATSESINSFTPAEHQRVDHTQPSLEPQNSSEDIHMTDDGGSAPEPALPGPLTLGQDDQGITSFLDDLFLLSPVDTQNIDWPREDFK
jgi:hypothetical protein